MSMIIIQDVIGDTLQLCKFLYDIYMPVLVYILFFSRCSLFDAHISLLSIMLFILSTLLSLDPQILTLMPNPTVLGYTCAYYQLFFLLRCSYLTAHRSLLTAHKIALPGMNTI